MTTPTYAPTTASPLTYPTLGPLAATDRAQVLSDLVHSADLNPAPPAPAPVSAPAGLEAWRAGVDSRPEPPSPQAIEVVLAGVRAHRSLADVTAAAGIPQGRVLDIVVGVGGRISQSRRGGTPVGRVRTSRGSQDHAHGVYTDADGMTTLVLPEGWERSAGHRRGVGRSYAAVAVSDPHLDDGPVQAWLRAGSQVQDVTYAHYSHLYSVALGSVFKTLHGLTDDIDVHNAYLTAFDSMADALSVASAAVVALCTFSGDPAAAATLMRRCSVMLPSAVAMISIAEAAATSGLTDELNRSLGLLRAAVARRPTAFFPRTLDDLPRDRFLALVATFGVSPEDMRDDVQLDRGHSALVSDLFSQAHALVAELQRG